ncbi:MAG: hypothetical protein ABH852_05480 [Methanobacteriota archaeon]
MSVVLCCGKKGCARIDFVADGVEIRDDQNVVKLSSDEWDLLVEKIKSGEM